MNQVSGTVNSPRRVYRGIGDEQPPRALPSIAQRLWVHPFGLVLLGKGQWHKVPVSSTCALLRTWKAHRVKIEQPVRLGAGLRTLLHTRESVHRVRG